MKTKNDALIVVYKKTITTELDRQQFTEFEKSLADYRIVRDELIKQVDDGNYAKANELAPSFSKISNCYVYIFRQRDKIKYGYGKN